MRLWHKYLLEYLPKAQLVSQWRECCAIGRSLADKGTPNHLLVNKLLEYNISHFNSYTKCVLDALHKRGVKTTASAQSKFYFNIELFSEKKQEELYSIPRIDIFPKWHDKNYLRICMANLAEKHFYGVGASQITDEEWNNLTSRYEELTGEKYKV